MGNFTLAEGYPLDPVVLAVDQAAAYEGQTANCVPAVDWRTPPPIVEEVTYGPPLSLYAIKLLGILTDRFQSADQLTIYRSEVALRRVAREGDTLVRRGLAEEAVVSDQKAWRRRQ